MFIGHVALDAEITTILMVRNTSAVPTAPDSAPTYRVYGEDGSPLATGTLTTKDGVTGLYGFNFTPTAGAGFAVGNTYSVLFQYVISAITYSPADATRTFTVI